MIDKQTPYAPLRRELTVDGWFSPDTYSNEFEEIADRAAVYLFLVLNQDGYDRALVAYVGMSTNLRQRLCGHPVLPQLDAPGFWTMRWFKPVCPTRLRPVEAHYISRFDPPWNISGRPRGVVLQ